jgi:hypothetical protein
MCQSSPQTEAFAAMAGASQHQLAEMSLIRRIVERMNWRGIFGESFPDINFESEFPNEHEPSKLRREAVNRPSAIPACQVDGNRKVVLRCAPGWWPLEAFGVESTLPARYHSTGHWDLAIFLLWMNDDMLVFTISRDHNLHHRDVQYDHCIFDRSPSAPCHFEAVSHSQHQSITQKYDI